MAMVVTGFLEDGYSDGEIRQQTRTLVTPPEDETPWTRGYTKRVSDTWNGRWLILPRPSDTLHTTD